MNHLPPKRPQSPPYRALQRRLLGLAGLLAVLMIALIAFHVLHTGSTGLNAVAEAAERTARQPGAKLALEVTYTVEGPTGTKTVVGEGSGAFNARSDRARVSLTVPIPGHGSMSIDSISGSRLTFLRSPVFSGELPPGKEWLGMEPFLGHDPETALGSNGSAKGQLELFATVGDGVEEVGQETVRGHLTTRYKGTVELAKAAALLSERGETDLAREFERSAEEMPDPIPVEAWIDEKGLTREIRLTEQLPSTTGGPAVTTDLRMQFFAFGTHPQIKLPPKRKVLDFTPVLRAELGLEDGSTLGPLDPPAGAKPLSATIFQRRAGELCRMTRSKVRALAEGGSGPLARLKALGHDATKSVEGREAMSAFADRVSEPSYFLLRRLIRRLASLVPPAPLTAPYRRYLRSDAKQAEWILAQARLLELGKADAPGFQTRGAEDKTEERERRRLAATLGISVCEKGPASPNEGTRA